MYTIEYLLFQLVCEWVGVSEWYTYIGNVKIKKNKIYTSMQIYE